MASRLGSKSLGTLLFGFGGAVGWFGNSFLSSRDAGSRKFPNCLEIDGRVIDNLPALPIFGEVSAATPYDTSSLVPSQDSMARRVGEIMRFGFPSLENVRSLDDFILSYDKRNRVANWVFEHLTPDRVKHNDSVDRSKCQFVEDESVHHFFRSTNADYKGSGFDRGHLAAAGNHRANQKHCEQTFLLSNMAPQVGKGFNRDSWNRLEQHVRKLVKTHPNVYVCTGPLYLPRPEGDGKLYVRYQVIGKSAVAVPTHFFKVVVAEDANNNLFLESYVMPNTVIDDNIPLNNFLVVPETIERASGLLFFDRLSKDKLKSINGKKV